ncbi:MAG: L,D-transpeptidase family protein [Chitinophagales bacterium]
MKLYRVFLLAALFLLGSVSIAGTESTFEDTQKGFERVRDAYDRKEELFFMKCRTKDIPETFGNMYIRVFKMEGIMELWVQKNPGGQYVKFNEYKVYALSGTLGPKRQQGDAQVPEGFYSINEFNPVSNYHLSLGVNYPNESDMKLSTASRKGGDIFIHGGAASAGCLAMSNYYIEDIYIAAVKARSQGQTNIPVHIFPFKMTDANMNYWTRVVQFKDCVKLWKNLQQGYSFFETNNRLPEVSVDASGYYKFYDPAKAQASAR